jgi:hypothetical protein
MAIKDMTMTTDIDSAGNEIVSEINATYTEVRSDGTEVTAEIATTADADNPTEIEGHMTVTETAADGTETITEVVVNEDGTFIVEDGSMLEQAVEATFGIEISDNLTPVAPAEDFSGDESTEVYLAESDFPADASDFTIGDEMFDPTVSPTDTTDVSSINAPFDSTFGTNDTAYSPAPVDDSTFGFTETRGAAFNAASETDAAEIAEQQVHAQAATDAQNAADEFIAAGDYAAAAEARETAENEAWEAGDNSMLSLYDAQDLSFAADKQQEAGYYNEQQAQFAQAGDYEAARDAADKAGYAMYEADSTAGGDDHTGQADAEKYNMDWAVHEEKQADYHADSAAAYAAEGDFERAEMYAASAVQHQERADDFGDLGEHGGDMAVYDPSSELATGGTYDSTFDSTAVDTGFDSSVDMTASSSFDAGTDDI